MCFLSFVGQKILSKCWMHKMSRKKPSCVGFFFAPNVLFVCKCFEGPTAPILERWSIQESDTSLRVPFLKKTFFLNLNKMCHKDFPIRGIQPPWSFWIVQVPFCYTKVPFCSREEPFSHNILIKFFPFG